MAVAECDSVLVEVCDCCEAQSMPRRLRTMRQFAEEEFILPNGPRAGMHFAVDVQPWTRLFFDEVESGRWQTINTTGGRQGGKTLVCSQTPLLYHLFEVGETVIYLVPDLELAAYKWNMDLKPVIERTRYQELVPTRGAGSRGGKVTEIEFRNGASLLFMTGGGGDAGRAGRTARVVIVTETDKMDEAAGGSEEADKIAQVIHCTDAYGSRRRIYQECTLTTSKGRTWRDYKAGTESRIVLHCPKCGGWVCPGREHLTGWKGAESELDAMERARWSCPACGQAWTEEERYRANAEAVLAHRGQEVTADGRVVGPLPKTRTLGFRWSCVNNMFLTAGDVAAQEWALEREEDDRKRDLKEREILQYVWALPYESKEDQIKYLDSKAVLARPMAYKRGEVPEWARRLTVGGDVHKTHVHWTAIAWGKAARGQVIDYGVVEVNPAGEEELAVERAILAALLEFKETYLDRGWISPSGGFKLVDAALFDSRYKPTAVREFIRRAGDKYYATLGFGATQRWGKAGFYRAPGKVTYTVPQIGEGYHLEFSINDSCYTVKIDADHWKSWVHSALEAKAGGAGSLTLFQVLNSKEHLSYSKHLTAERQVTEFVPGKGDVVRWEQISQNNHWLDSTALACVGGHIAGVRVMEDDEILEEDTPAGDTDLSAWLGGKKRR